METLITILIFFFILPALASASLLYTWFNSSLPRLLLTILKALGLKRKSPDFYILTIDKLSGAPKSRSPITWSEGDWEEFTTSKLPPYLGELLTCRYCLCYHCVFWTNLLFYILYALSNITLPSFGVLIALILSQPILVHFIFKWLK